MKPTGPSSDDFEAKVAEHLRQLGRNDERQLAALMDYAETVPQERRRWLSARLLWAAAVPLATLTLITAVVAGGFGATTVESTRPSLTSVGPSVGPSFVPTALPTSSTTSSATQTPVVSPTVQLPDPAAYAGDPRLRWCGGLNDQGTKVLTIYDFGQSSEYKRRLPALGYSAALDKTDPVLVLIYDGPSPSDLIVDGGQARTHSPSEGTFDICVGASNWHQRYLNVSIDWPALQGASTASKT